jgi:hypothetical protein
MTIANWKIFGIVSQRHSLDHNLTSPIDSIKTFKIDIPQIFDPTSLNLVLDHLLKGL